ncbi:glycerophosphodiester phosphodiesterase [Secundilactobacillus pentosiphilus]|uniref:Glycerophosphodiester phosphodiesterase n=1 Tax=Secundilactobacillus pentosiphilus TaxID=1714682 RepID=A0A1Z5IWM3_9LACO|nr:glycerophosphodiester phosphodiesterase [Secundilactobacillus pentosiphilus]GAX06184.1 glycerophosphodiester phosphodiesterase [Secundilactobacillus pentosiphilus]
MKPINYYRRLFQTSYQLLKVRAVNLGWLLLLAVLVTLHILMLNPGLVAVKIILIIGFLFGLVFELDLILTAFTTNKTILNQTDLLMLTSWRRLSKRWLQLTGLVILLAILWLPFGDAGFTAPVLNLVMLPIKWVDTVVLQRRIVVAILAVLYVLLLFVFLKLLGYLRVTVKPELVPINGWHRLVWFVRPLVAVWVPMSVMDHLAVHGLRALSSQLSNGVGSGTSLVTLVLLVVFSLIGLSVFLLAMVWESVAQPDFQPEFSEDEEHLHSMAWFPAGLVFLLVILFGFQAFHFGSIAASPSITIAHRGVIGSNGVPNSLDAFKRTVKHQPNFVEVDVQETRDGQFVVSHGQDVNLRTSAGAKVADIQKLTLNQLKHHHLEKDGKATKIVSLASYLKAAKEEHQRLIVEIKVTPQDSPNMVQRFSRQYADQLIANHDFVHTMSYQALLRLKQLDPNLIVGYIVPLNIMSIKNLPADFYSLQAIGLNTTMIRQAHSVGAPVFVWTPDKVADMQSMRVLGVDGQITNQLTQLQRVNRQLIKQFNWAIVENVVNQFC